jgi:hypothetical protein
MRFLAILMLAAGFVFGQGGSDGRPDTTGSAPTPSPDAKSPYVCKLETVTWNPDTKELGWVISMKPLAAGPETPEVQVKYLIHIDTAIMHVKDEDRKLDQEDAKLVEKLLNLITAYTVDSTVQWSKGAGEKVTGTDAVPAKKNIPSYEGVGAVSGSPAVFK